MKKERSPKDKLTRIMQVSTVAITLFCIALLFVLRLCINVPTVVLMAVILPLLWGGLWLLGKILEKGRYKDVFDEMNKEAEMEEEQEKKKGQKPNISGLVLLSVAVLLFAVITGAEMVSNMIKDKSFVDYLPDLCMVLTFLLCGFFLARISYNIKRGKVFFTQNSRLIYYIAFTVLLSTNIQAHYWESTTMVPNSTVLWCYLVFVGLVFFFGHLYNIAIEIKEDLDLTI